LNRTISLLDQFLPTFDAHEVHSIALQLPPRDAIAAALGTPVAADPLVRALLRARGLRTAGTIGGSLRRIGLLELARTDSEIVLGGSGTPWRPRGGINPFADAAAGQVRIVVDFCADGERLTTETRVAAVDEAALRAFQRYWRVVGPFSAVIRRRWLETIARTAA
jgi:hypothetical protein